MLLLRSICLIACLCFNAYAAPHLFRQFVEAGQLSESEATEFVAAHAQNAEVVGQMLNELKKRKIPEEEGLNARQGGLLGGLLGGLHGGGLLNGVLQPFTGVLAGLDVPTPQPVGKRVVPGNDPNHQFQYPGPTDVRGPCPGLNTMANHGYISRSGITTFAESANACQTAFGFGYDTSIAVAALGLLSGGDLGTGKFSIGGEDPRVPNTFGPNFPALGVSRHGLFESDNSITRQDAYFGNQANFDLERWNRLVSITNIYGGGQFTQAALGQERVVVYNESIATNPDFDAGVVWFAVSTAVRGFLYAVFPNGTNPGVADFQNIAPFYLNETFPKNWYTHSTAYSLVDVAANIVGILAASPQLTLLGANEGVNNFTPLNLNGLDITHLTPTQALCFIATTIMGFVPGELAPITANGIDVIQAFIDGAIAPIFSSYNCPIQTYASPGPNAGVPGVSTTENVLINGVYQS